MRSIPLLVALLTSVPVFVAGQTSPTNLEAQIAQIDRLAADPDAKLQLLHRMAVDLGTHRNRLILLKKQSEETFGQIYVRELRAGGFNDDTILKKLRSLEQRMKGVFDSEQAPQGFQPLLYVGTTVDRNSAGTFVALSPEVGVDSERFALVAGIPVYGISATQREVTGIGDAYVAGFLRHQVGRYDLGTSLTLGFPTGDRSQGFGAGRISVDLNGTVQRGFERIRLFVTGGFTNSVFNNVGYQRPFISNGNALYASGGLDYRLHRRLTAGVGGFALHAMGTHTVISRMTGVTPGSPPTQGMPPGGMPPGNMQPGPGTGMPGSGMMPSGGLPFYGRSSQVSMPGDDLADRGVSGWVLWSLHPGVTLNLTLARSVPYELTTVRVGVGFDLSRPFSRLFRR
ncbi:MAG: hypothetical protein Q8N47_16455 [Bryobacterales bacterium]|nr:hypothetical protein [Bryobacterales bacterium]